MGYFIFTMNLPFLQGAVKEKTTTASANFDMIEFMQNFQAEEEKAQDNLQINFGRLKQAVLARRPALKALLEKHGHDSVFNFIKTYIVAPVGAVNFKRQEELIDSVTGETERLLGKEVANSVKQQLATYYYVSTTDHFGPNYHPWVVNFNLIASASIMDQPDPKLKNIITLACSNVSLNNFSFPRGFAFTSNAAGTLKNNRVSFLPSNAHSYPVYGFRAFQPSELQKVKDQLRELTNKKIVTKELGEKITALVNEVYGAPEVMSAGSFADQVTKTNYTLWKKLYATTNQPELNFVYLEQEWIVADLLAKHHLFKPESSLYKMLFNADSEALLAEYFANVPEGFNKEKKLGTYLFWGLPKINCNHRLRMWKEGNWLIADDGSYKVEWTPAAIAEALKKKELIPSVMLTFITLCFYYGLKCLGGLGQINYLPKLKEAYIKLQEKLGNQENIAVVKDINCGDLGGEVTVALMNGKNGETAPATLPDLLLNATSATCQRLTDQMKKLTFEEAIVPMFAEDYPMLYSHEERDEALKAITPKQITQLIGLDTKIEPCVEME